MRVTTAGVHDGHRSVHATSERLDLSRHQVTLLAATGVLKASVVGGRVVIDLESIERYERERDAANAPAPAA